MAQPATIRNVSEVAAPLDKAQPRVAPGSTVRVDVVVRTRKIGHFFPGGTVDAFDVWLELEARDKAGRTIFWSGRAANDGKGPVETGAHFYRSYQLDGDGNPINKRNAWQTRSALYVRLIPPGAADVAHYRIRIPSDAQGPISLTAKLNYRKFAHYYTQFAFAGQPKPGQSASLVGPGFDNREWSFDAANIPANVSSEIQRSDSGFADRHGGRGDDDAAAGRRQTTAAWTPIASQADRERWNDWGIGLLLQGDLKGAEYAFTTGDEGGARVRGWMAERRARAHSGGGDRRREAVHR